MSASANNFGEAMYALADDAAVAALNKFSEMYPSTKMSHKEWNELREWFAYEAWSRRERLASVAFVDTDAGDG